MKKIIFVTSNEGKYKSAKRFLRNFGVDVIQKNVETPEPRGSLEKIAIQKAKYAHKILKEPLIALDAGFFIESLNGFPMMFTNFVLETIGNEGILKLAEGRDRKCEFREVLCLVENSRTKPKLFDRVVRGKLASEAKGNLKPHHWSKLALIFIPENENKTMAEMTEKEIKLFRKKIEKNSHWEQLGKTLMEL